MLLATHQPIEMDFSGRIITLKPGQLITSRKSLSDSCGVSQSKTERVLAWMESEQQIEQQGSNRSRLITILNWDKYQPIGQQNEHPSDSHRTTNGQPSDTNKNEKNERMKEKTVGEKASPPTAEEIISQFENDKTYEGINVRIEFGKMAAWCGVKRKHPTKQRFVNWLNRVERPIQGINETNNGTHKPNPRNDGIFKNAPGSIGAAVKAQQSLFTKPDANAS